VFDVFDVFDVFFTVDDWRPTSRPLRTA